MSIRLGDETRYHLFFSLSRCPSQTTEKNIINSNAYNNSCNTTCMKTILRMKTLSAYPRSSTTFLFSLSLSLLLLFPADRETTAQTTMETREWNLIPPQRYIFLSRSRFLLFCKYATIRDGEKNSIHAVLLIVRDDVCEIYSCRLTLMSVSGYIDRYHYR